MAREQMRTPRVFISMGTPYRSQYTVFRDELVSLLEHRLHVDARMLGVNERPSGTPLHKIRDVIETCDGVLIVAFERKHVTMGVDGRGGSKEIDLSGKKFTTPWNHIESAIAFSLRLPLYIIAETGLTEEGLIEQKIDWYVQSIDFTPAALASRDVEESLRSWITERVIPHSRRPRALLAGVAKLRLSEMTGEEWAAILAMLGVAFGAGMAAAKFLPTIFH